MDWSVFWTAVGSIAAVAAVSSAIVIYWLDQRKNEATDTTLCRIEGSNWLLEKGLTYEALLRRLIGLDYMTLDGLNERSEGTVHQWAPVFAKSPESWKLVVFGDSLIVGYWAFFALSDSLMTKLRSGVMFDSEITDRDVVRIESHQTYDVYFSMITRQPDFGSCGCSIYNLLLQSLLKTFEGLKLSGVEIRNIYTNGFTSDGQTLCRQLSMTAISDALQGGQIFHVEVTDKLFDRIKRLANNHKEYRRNRAY